MVVHTTKRGICLILILQCLFQCTKATISLSKKYHAKTGKARFSFLKRRGNVQTVTVASLALQTHKWVLVPSFQLHRDQFFWGWHFITRFSRPQSNLSNSQTIFLNPPLVLPVALVRSSVLEERLISLSVLFSISCETQSLLILQFKTLFGAHYVPGPMLSAGDIITTQVTALIELLFRGVRQWWSVRLDGCVISEGTGRSSDTSEEWPQAHAAQGVGIKFPREILAQVGCKGWVEIHPWRMVRVGRRGSSILDGKSIMYQIPGMRELEVSCHVWNPEHQRIWDQIM